MKSYKELSENKIIIPSDTSEQLNRILILIASLKGGNSSSEIVKEISFLLDELYNKKLINKEVYKTLYYKSKNLYNKNVKT